MKSKLDNPVTITIPADRVEDILSALAGACDNAAYWRDQEGVEDDGDTNEVREAWDADEKTLGELHGMIHDAARQCDGCGCRNVTVTVESTTAGDETARNYCAHCAGGAA